jgi:hypothetical protein
MARLKVEMIVWHDASKADRKEFKPDPMLLASFGAVIHEDKKQVILLAEAEHRPDYMSRDMDYTQIPKKLISNRVVVGEVDLPLPKNLKEIVKVKRGKKVDVGKGIEPLSDGSKTEGITV